MPGLAMTSRRLVAAKNLMRGCRDAYRVRFDDAGDAAVGERKNLPVVDRINDGLKHWSVLAVG